MGKLATAVALLVLALPLVSAGGSQVHYLGPAASRATPEPGDHGTYLQRPGGDPPYVARIDPGQALDLSGTQTFYVHLDAHEALAEGNHTTRIDIFLADADGSILVEDGPSGPAPVVVASRSWTVFLPVGGSTGRGWSDFALDADPGRLHVPEGRLLVLAITADIDGPLGSITTAPATRAVKEAVLDATPATLPHLGGDLAEANALYNQTSRRPVCFACFTHEVEGGTYSAVHESIRNMPLEEGADRLVRDPLPVAKFDVGRSDAPSRLEIRTA